MVWSLHPGSRSSGRYMHAYELGPAFVARAPSLTSVRPRGEWKEKVETRRLVFCVFAARKGVCGSMVESPLAAQMDVSGTQGYLSNLLRTKERKKRTWRMEYSWNPSRSPPAASEILADQPQATTPRERAITRARRCLYARIVIGTHATKHQPTILLQVFVLDTPISFRLLVRPVMDPKTMQGYPELPRGFPRPVY